MNRFVVDLFTTPHLVVDEVEVDPGHRPVAPTLLRSDVSAALDEAVRGVS